MKQPMAPKLLIDEVRIRNRIAILAEEIAEEFNKEPLVVVGLLNGSFVFLADLIRQLNRFSLSLIIDFMRISSYGSGMVTSREPKLVQDISVSIKNRHVLIVDDILDTGYTLAFVKEHLKDDGPAGLSSCVFLDKSECRQVDIRADYVGFTIPDAFVVGYGLDYDGRYRELPCVSVLSEEED